MSKSGFLLKTEWKSMIQSLPDEQAGLLFKAIYDYNDTQEYTLDNPILNAVFQLIKESLDSNNAKYEAKCEAKRKAAEERWRKDKECESMQNDADACTCMQQDADGMHMDYDASLSLSLSNTSTHNQGFGKDIGGAGGKGKPLPEVVDVVDHLNKVCGTKYRATTAGVQKHINARLKDGFSVDDLKRVVDKKAKEWMGDPKMQQYLRPMTLFNSEKFESYLNQPEAKARSGTTSFTDELLAQIWEEENEQNRVQEADSGTFTGVP